MSISLIYIFMNNTYFVLLDCVHGNCIFQPWKTALKLHYLSEFVPICSRFARTTNISAAPFYSATVFSRDCRSVFRKTASCGYWKSLHKYEYVFCVLIRKHSALTHNASVANGNRRKEHRNSLTNIFSGVSLEKNMELVI